MRKIAIELSPGSCQQAIAELKAYKKQIDPKVEEVCKRLAMLGRDTAQAFFDIAGEGNGGVTVTAELLFLREDNREALYIRSRLLP